MDVFKATSILIIPRQTSDQTFWLAASALIEALSQTDKEFSLFVDPVNDYKKDELFPEGLHVLNKNEANGIIITLENLHEKILGLDWKQDEKNLEIEIKTAQGEISQPDVHIKQLVSNYDLKIFLGLNREEAEKNLTINSLNLTSGTSVFFDQDDTIKGVYEIINKLTDKPSHSVYDKLLQALYIYTENFKVHVDPETFSFAAELMKNNNSDKDNKVLDKKKPITTKSNLKNKTKQKNLEKVKQLEAVEPQIVNISDNNEAQEEKSEKEEKETTSIIETPVNSPTEITPKNSNYDPLAPATIIPEPIKLTKVETTKPVDNSPLPAAS